MVMVTLSHFVYVAQGNVTMHTHVKCKTLPPSQLEIMTKVKGVETCHEIKMCSTR